jgi:hypothetical protein
MACLVQQLFRQKIGKELPPEFVDDVLFPLLLPRKHGPSELLLDIKMTRTYNDEGESAISISPSHRSPNQALTHGPRNIPPFTPVPALFFNRRRVTSGRTTSHFRRKMMTERAWGSIEILNELRELNHPRIGYQVSPDQQTDVLEWPVGPNISEELEDMFIRLEEFRHWSDPRRTGIGKTLVMFRDIDGAVVNVSDWMQKKRDTDLKLVNDFLENSLVDDNGLSWGGNPESNFKPMLSIHY